MAAGIVTLSVMNTTEAEGQSADIARALQSLVKEHQAHIYFCCYRCQGDIVSYDVIRSASPSTGQCFDAHTDQPIPGLEYSLATPTQPDLYDTIVMANLGYFQLKAGPGVWTLSLREGRSRDMYTVTRWELYIELLLISTELHHHSYPATMAVTAPAQVITSW